MGSAGTEENINEKREPCYVCHLLRQYIPVLTRPIECLKCSRVLHPPKPPSNVSTRIEKDKKARKKKRSRRLSSTNERDESYRPRKSSLRRSSELGSPMRFDQAERRLDYVPDTPESESGSREILEKDNENSEESDVNDNYRTNRCDGCRAIRFGDWVQCSLCSNWNCYQCVPNIPELGAEDVVYHCKACLS